jgi:putative lipoic acid-binding regulatory protein
MAFAQDERFSVPKFSTYRVDGRLCHGLPEKASKVAMRHAFDMSRLNRTKPTSMGPFHVLRVLMRGACLRMGDCCQSDACY